MSRTRRPRCGPVVLTAALATAALATAALAGCTPVSSADAGPATATGSPAATSAAAGVATPGAAAATATLRTYSPRDPGSLWVVVDKRHPLPPSYQPDLVVFHGYYVDVRTVAALTSMFTAAQDDGVVLSIVSAYRSYAYQERVHDHLVAEEGAAAADRYSARAGYSEHQTGLAVDIGSSTQPACNVSACFATTPEGAWTARHGAAYGFLLRYTAADAAVTGYDPEPWHLRYVGPALIAAMQARHVPTLEQYFGVSGGDRYAG